MTLRKNLHWFIYAIFLFSCARQTSPTGGPKDTIPPVLVRATPANEAINFKADQLQLIFSEDVILNAPKEQLIITPTIGDDYEITYRKNIVTIKFEDPLADSTTYTFNFRETVQDITEKNPVENLQLAYSTGHYIDSLSIQGTLYDMLTGTPAKDLTVALHVENDTFNIFEHPAVYFTKTDNEGKFIISHLKPANYFIYAIQDKNRNLIANSRTESYGFVSDYQYLIENVKDISIGLVRLDAGPLKITSARPYNTYFNIRTTKNLQTFKITPADSTEDLSYSFGENQANIRLYDTTEKDSIQIHLLAIDSIDNVIDTTLYAKYLTRAVTPETFTVNVTESSLLAHTGAFNAVLQFSKPLKEINFDSIYFQVDSLTRLSFGPTDLTWEPLTNRMTINKLMDHTLFQNGETNRASSRGTRIRTAPTSDTTQLKNPIVNEMNFRPAAFISIENDSSQAIAKPVTPRKQADLSVITIAIKTTAPSYFVQLLDNTQKVIRQVQNKSVIRFEDIIPGEYKIRMIIDRNDNGRWDPGNYFTNTEPEPIIYYRAADGSTTIKGVKANWEIGAGEMFITY